MNNFLSQKMHFFHTPKGQNSHKEITMIIESYFREGIFLSNPLFQEKSDKLTISLFYYAVEPNLTQSNMETLTKQIMQLANKEVSLVMTRVYYPYMNSSILAKYLAHNSSANTFVHFRNAILKYPRFAGSHLPSHICGIRIQLAGRLATERVIPRVTKNVSVFGSLSNADYIDYAYHTQKNYLGTFTIKV
jgi:hypothetical protein